MTTILGATQRGLLALLSDGQWHSGESLGESLGVSRAAVSKHVKQIQELGLVLETLKGVGYRAEQFELLDVSRVHKELESANVASLAQLEIVGSIPSTNQYLLDEFRRGEDIHGRICLAEQQTRGRGRRGRVWHSPFARNLYISLGWSFDGGVAQIEGLSLAVGVIICETLEALGFEQSELKWPNDILVGSKKLGGVLIELGGDAAGSCSVVVGLGLNVDMMPEGVRQSEITQPWTSLMNEKAKIGRNLLAGKLCSELMLALITYAEKGFRCYRARWTDRAAFLNECVELQSASNVVTGLMQGVGDKGELLLEVDGVVQAHLGGEMSLRVAT